MIMRVFVTGATGFVGGAVIPELIAGGHEVLGLTRSEEGVKALEAMGAEAHRGTLQDLPALEAGARDSDGVIHLAFNHDFSKFEQNCEDDRRAIEAMGAVLERSGRPLLVTSGLAMIAPGRIATETDTPSPHLPRASEQAAAAVAARGVQATAVRLAPSTHGAGDHGFVPILIGIAREKGVAAYIGDGSNRWPGVHRHDAARLYRLALEHGAQGGPYHAAAEEGVPFKAIAEAIGRGLGLPVVSVSPEQAEAHFGWFTTFAGMDIPTSSAHTRTLLGWEPREIGLLADIEAHYFAH
jgi:nucleoside-diphosphate-sugar epimerase